MKRNSTLLFALLLVLGVSANLMAQNYQVYLGLGVAALRGEVTDEGIFSEEYGLDYSIKYLQPLKDERLVFTGEASHTSANLMRTFANSDGSKLMVNSFSQTYAGVGLRWIFNNEVNTYKPYAGQFLPFAGISIGGLSTNRDLTMEDNMPQFFKKAPKDPTQGYEFHDGNTFEFNGQVEGGFVYVIAPFWSVSASAAARPGFSDTWDGITGMGDGNDWLVRTSVGLQYAL